MKCDLCDTWEHMICTRVPDRLDEALYEAVTQCHSKAILYCCYKCRKRGSLIKRINKLESECASLSKQQLASSRDRNKVQEVLEQLCLESQREREGLLAELNM